MRRFLGGMLAAAILAAVTPAGAATTNFDGEYGGSGTRSGGDRTCPESIQQLMHVYDGLVSMTFGRKAKNLAGSVADDGTVSASVVFRSGGGSNMYSYQLKGKIIGASFKGAVDADNCQHTENLEKK
jgi:hypothetical protein